MSFRERVLEICESDISCYNCPLRSTCNKVSDVPVTFSWKDEDFDSLKQYLKEYHAELSEKLTVIEEMLKED